MKKEHNNDLKYNLLENQSIYTEEIIETLGDILANTHTRFANQIFNNWYILEGLKPEVSYNGEKKYLKVSHGKIHLKGHVIDIVDLSEENTVKYLDEFEGTQPIIKVQLKFETVKIKNENIGQVNRIRAYYAINNKKISEIINKNFSTNLKGIGSGEKLEILETNSINIFEVNFKKNGIVNVSDDIPKKSKLKISDLDGKVHASQIESNAITHKDGAEGGLFGVMAERTMDQSGSFLAEGLSCNQIYSDLQDGKIGISVTKGKAYVKGFRLETEDTKFLNLDPETSTEKAKAESLREHSAIIPLPKEIKIKEGSEILICNDKYNLKKKEEITKDIKKLIRSKENIKILDYSILNNDDIFSYQFKLEKKSYLHFNKANQNKLKSPLKMQHGKYSMVLTAVKNDQVIQIGKQQIEIVEDKGFFAYWVNVENINKYKIYFVLNGYGLVEDRIISTSTKNNFVFVNKGQIEGIEVKEVKQINKIENLEIKNLNLDLPFIFVHDSLDKFFNSKARRCELQYEYFFGRKDLIFATEASIKIKTGSPGINPKTPKIKAEYLPLARITLLPNSFITKIKNYNYKPVSVIETKKNYHYLDDFKKDIDLNLRKNQQKLENLIGKVKKFHHYSIIKQMRSGIPMFLEESNDVFYTNFSDDLFFDAINSSVIFNFNSKTAKLESEIDKAELEVLEAETENIQISSFQRKRINGNKERKIAHLKAQKISLLEGGIEGLKDIRNQTHPLNLLNQEDGKGVLNLTNLLAKSIIKQAKVYGPSEDVIVGKTQFTLYGYNFHRNEKVKITSPDGLFKILKKDENDNYSLSRSDTIRTSNKHGSFEKQLFIEDIFSNIENHHKTSEKNKFRLFFKGQVSKKTAKIQVSFKNFNDWKNLTPEVNLSEKIEQNNVQEKENGLVYTFKCKKSCLIKEIAFCLVSAKYKEANFFIQIFKIKNGKIKTIFSPTLAMYPEKTINPRIYFSRTFFAKTDEEYAIKITSNIDNFPFSTKYIDPKEKGEFIEPSSIFIIENNEKKYLKLGKNTRLNTIFSIKQIIEDEGKIKVKNKEKLKNDYHSVVLKADKKEFDSAKIKWEMFRNNKSQKDFSPNEFNELIRTDEKNLNLEIEATFQGKDNITPLLDVSQSTFALILKKYKTTSELKTKKIPVKKDAKYFCISSIMEIPKNTMVEWFVAFNDSDYWENFAQSFSKNGIKKQGYDYKYKLKRIENNMEIKAVLSTKDTKITPTIYDLGIHFI